MKYLKIYEDFNKNKKPKVEDYDFEYLFQSLIDDCDDEVKISKISYISSAKSFLVQLDGPLVSKELTKSIGFRNPNKEYTTYSTSGYNPKFFLNLHDLSEPIQNFIKRCESFAESITIHLHLYDELIYISIPVNILENFRKR